MIKTAQENGGWCNKMAVCSICKDLFIVRKNAKTADTRSLCYKCRRSMKEMISELDQVNNKELSK